MALPSLTASIRARLPALRWFAPGFLLYSVLRIPSFFEPHWYTDEASYVSVGRALLRGQVLYTQTWNNKPPLQSWTVALEVQLFGSSEAGLHLLTFISGALAVAAVAWAAWRLLTPPRALIATLIAALALGLPVLDAELAIPESLLIAPLSWAGALLLVNLKPHGEISRSRSRWPVAVGLLAAAAIAYQQTAVAEASAFALVIALSPRARVRDLGVYITTIALVTGAWVAVVILQAGAGNVGFALVGFYIPYTQSVFPETAGGIAVHLAEVGAAGVLLVAGGVLSRRLQGVVWVLFLWAGAALMIAALSRQPYAHYLTPAVAPLALLAASVPIPRRLSLRERSTALRLAPQFAGLLVTASMASGAGLDWIPAAAPSPLLNASRTLGTYYAGIVGAALDNDQYEEWVDAFDSRVGADAAVSDWLRAQGLAGTTAVVWSSDAWLYALADLEQQMPTPPIYNDEVLFGINGPVADRVDFLSPTLIIVAEDALAQFPEVRRLLDGSKYQRLFVSEPDTVWVRGDIAATLPGPEAQVSR